MIWLLAAFFVVGGFGNIFASADIKADYRSWGYPDWFHYLTGLLELTTASLLSVRRTRLWGAALGSAVMTAAGATVLFHGEYAHAIAPLAVLCALVLAGWIAFQDRPA
ncbi:DoxX family protein [Bradyrhizobium sp. USDA 4502]